MPISTIGANSLAQSRIITAVQQPVGAVLQVVSTTKTDSFSTSSGSFVDITGLSVSITPTSATSKILIIAAVNAGAIFSANMGFNLVRGSTNIAQSTGGTGNQTATQNYGSNYQSITNPIIFYDTPATTSATTYKIQINCTTSLGYVNLRSTDQYYGSISTITVMEISA
jgi:hypothetical protein